jgi:hypothetical protein
VLPDCCAPRIPVMSAPPDYYLAPDQRVRIW